MHHDGTIVIEGNTAARMARKLPRPDFGMDRQATPLRLHRSSRIRRDLVARVRAEIEAGTYLTEARTTTAIARLFNELDHGGGQPEAAVPPASRTG